MNSFQEVDLKPCARKECENEFKPYRTTDKYCSYNCTRKSKEKSLDGKKPINKTKIPQQSASMIKKLTKYSKLKKAFLALPENKFCPITGKAADQIHHKKGRIGSLLLDTRFWLAVSHDGHRKIEEKPDWAKEMGYSLSRLAK
tara:strand:+ start:650 stop:1078 length:429 start_codon:yes stop_codon:yes gene_type:complete